MSALDETWTRVDGYLRSRLRPDLYERWFAPLRASAIDDGRLHVAAPDKFHRDFVDDNYRPWFEEFLPAVVGERAAGRLRRRRRSRPAAPPPPTRPRRPRCPPTRRRSTRRDARPSPRYTFETFVVGESNRFAFAAAQAVAQKPGHACNPLFLHGDSGLGKTHLLHAIAQRHPRASRPRRPRRGRLLRALHQRLRRRPRARARSTSSAASTASAPRCSSTTSSSSPARTRPPRSSSTPSTPSTSRASRSSSPATAAPRS